MYLIYLIIFLEILIYIIFKKSNLLLSKKDLFPKISKVLIDKFNSFDSELGWVNKKNTTKKEPSQGKEIIYTYNNIGARSIGKFDIKEAYISTYGDSYCLSREVEDTQTWQYNLSNMLNANVINFGVGNYGLDQSLLRLKKEYKNNPTKIVIMAITPYTITRITSVWKHFSEFENILAFKPRFIVDNKKLTLIPNIINDKKQLEYIEDYKDYLYKYDEHIDYFNKYIYKFPFFLSFLLSPTPLIRAILAKLSSLFKKTKLFNISQFFSYKYFLPEIYYRKELFIKNKELVDLLLKEYIKFANENNFQPLLLLLPTIEDVKYYSKTNDKYYFNFNKGLVNQLKVFDFMDILSKTNKEINQYFVDSIWGGHYSVLGNMELAIFLKERLNETD